MAFSKSTAHDIPKFSLKVFPEDKNVILFPKVCKAPAPLEAVLPMKMVWVIAIELLLRNCNVNALPLLLINLLSTMDTCIKLSLEWSPSDMNIAVLLLLIKLLCLMVTLFMLSRQTPPELESKVEF